MRCDAMRCDAMRCDAMRCDARWSARRSSSSRRRARSAPPPPRSSSRSTTWSASARRPTPDTDRAVRAPLMIQRRLGCGGEERMQATCAGGLRRPLACDSVAARTARIRKHAAGRVPRVGGAAGCCAALRENRTQSPRRRADRRGTEYVYSCSLDGWDHTIP